MTFASHTTSLGLCLLVCKMKLMIPYKVAVNREWNSGQGQGGGILEIGVEVRIYALASVGKALRRKQ